MKYALFFLQMPLGHLEGRGVIEGEHLERGGHPEVRRTEQSNLHKISVYATFEKARCRSKNSQVVDLPTQKH
jgi:hypothetical protein